MSMSTSGGSERQPGAVRVGKKAVAGGKPGDKPAAGGKPAAAKAGGAKGGPAKAGSGKGGGPRPGGARGGGKGRKPIKPVSVAHSRNWGLIAIITAVALFCGAIVGYGLYASHESSRSLADKAKDIKGVVNYLTNPDKSLTSNAHKTGVLPYKLSPPVGGDHNPNPEDCNGDVYTQQIPNEHAVHSLEHGAVWIAYRPDLPADQVAKLASKVRGQDYTMMSPYPGLDHAVSLQAWGYQLKLDDVNDKRIDQFIKTFRVVAAPEQGIACTGGVTVTGTVPQDTGGMQQQAPQPTGN
jgi:hypothetical protein